MSSLGVYFGPKVISIVETNAKNIINNIQILQSTITTSELEDKVPSEIKMVALFKDELRKNKIEAKDIAVALPGKDLVIRTFDLPPMPRQELENAVKFEAKKYIPFKIEELIADFQVQFDKSAQKNSVLFVGIKKEAFDRYASLVSQLDMKISVIEYAAFSALRLPKLSNVDDKGIIALVSADFKEDDEANFVVTENGFPLFSRDIALGETGAITPAAETDPGMLLEKLKTETRISLDYYHRKFPTKKIEKVIFIVGQDYRADLEVFIKDVGFSTQFLEVDKFIKTGTPFSLSLIKGYSCSLSKITKTALKIDLLAAPAKAKAALALKERKMAALSLASIVREHNKMLISGILICIAVFMFGIYRIMPVKKELDSIISQRPQVAGVSADLTSDELANLASEYKRKVENLDKLIKGQTYLTRVLEAAARVKPEGLWLKTFNFKKTESTTELELEGMASLGAGTDSDTEFALVNEFLSRLKENQTVSKYFPEINITSLDRKQFKETMVTAFTIVCRSPRK